MRIKIEEKPGPVRIMDLSPGDTFLSPSGLICLVTNQCDRDSRSVVHLETGLLVELSPNQIITPFPMVAVPDTEAAR